MWVQNNENNGNIKRYLREKYKGSYQKNSFYSFRIYSI